MKKTLLFLAIIFCLSSSVHGQSKVNLAIRQQFEKKSAKSIDVFIKGDVARIKELIAAGHGKLKYTAGDLVAAHLSFIQIATLLADKGIHRIEAYPSHLTVMNDSMLINNNVLPVHNGQSPLLQALDGKGIVIGIIDTGIDFTHPDFLDSLGKTRVKFIWDQTADSAANTPAAYGYGQEWNNVQIDSGKCTPSKDGHGTHVTGIAAGNGRANMKYKGVAPQADLIEVTLDFTSNNSVIADAVDYIYSKADMLGKPCVINASIGDYYGSHDGMDLQSQLIKNLINQKKGRSLVASAGNKGDSRIHLGYTVTADTNFTFFRASPGYVYIAMWGDTANLKNVQTAIGAVQLSPNFSYRGQTGFLKVSSSIGIYRADTLRKNGKRIGIVESYGDISGGTYSMEYFITPDSASYVWRLLTTGSGKFDLWDLDMVSSGLPSSHVMHDSIFYKLPDLNQTMVSGFQCLDNVITVGNYTNRKTYLDYNNVLYVAAGTPGLRHPSSSCGPTRDGRIKPDISAPGDVILSSLVQSLKAFYIANQPSALTQDGYYVRSGGTSAASPGVAGIAALYLQKNPDATAMDIKQAIINCSRKDAFTGITPNNMYGYGKADAFKTMLCNVIGINDNEKESLSFTIYPNPATTASTVTVEFSFIPGASIQSLCIYNELGACVAVLNPAKGHIQLTQQLSRGIYFCKLISSTQVIATKKLVIL